MAENNILNNSHVIGVGGRNLVLNTLGRVYVKVQEKYYEIDFKNGTVGGTGSGYGGVIVVNTNAEALALSYPGDNILILSKEGSIYYTQNGTINLLGLDVNNLIDPIIRGTVTINNGTKPPIIVESPILCPGLNSELLNGLSSDKFAIKSEAETIKNSWTFESDTFIEMALIGNSSNTILDFESSRLQIDYIDVRKGITGVEIILPEPLIELDDNEHIKPVEDTYGFYTQQFVSCRGLDTEASGSIGYATETFVRQSIADLVAGAPTTLDTLKEIADMLMEHKNIVDIFDDLINDHTKKLDTLFSYFNGDAARYAMQLKNPRLL
ncbi:MAG: hypothetical protein J6V44_11995 [Methanobrevibacter sp.]|nr:hypothetical protein [Methanobrevibacter sp.]